MTTLLLVRHGETDWNAEGRLQGHTDRPLNDYGRRQAATLAERLSDDGITAVYTSDLARARDFYERGLGWTPTGDYDGVSFYQLPGIAFALFGRGDLAEDTRHPIDGRFSGITIAVNQRSEADVDVVLAQAEAAGGTVLKAAEHTEWGGYSGYFADLDGHVWEIAVNPAWTVNEDGTLTI